MVLIGETDGDGVLRTKDVMRVGKVWLQYPDRRALRVLEEGKSIDLLAAGRDSQGNEFPGVGSTKLESYRDLNHSGDPDLPDVWEIDVDWMFALDVRLPGVGARGSMELTLVSADGDMASSYALSPKRPFFAAPDWIHQSSLEIWAAGGDLIRGAGSLSDWRRSRVHLHMPGRILRAVMFTREEGIFAAEADATEVPSWHDRAILLEFRPLTETDTAQIYATYERNIAERILRTIDQNSRDQEKESLAVATISGVMTSHSGTYHDRVQVIARPKAARGIGTVPFPSGTNQVEWTEGAAGQWTGRFELSGLAATTYRVQFKLGGDAFMESNLVEALAPHQFGEGELVILDDKPSWPVILEVSGPRGEIIFGYTATMTASPGGVERTASVVASHAPPSPYPRPDTPEELVLPIKVPEDGEFSVTITAKGFDEEVVRSSAMRFDGERWLASVVLTTKK